MKIIEAGYKIIRPKTWEGAKEAIYSVIEEAGRTCYKSEAAMTPESGARFITKLIENRHEAMLEHAHMTVKFIVDRGVSHEMVRHRIASFAQESTRYCNYSKDKFGKELTFIEPVFFKHIPKKRREEIAKYGNGVCNDDGSSMLEKRYGYWCCTCHIAELSYLKMIENYSTPQEARDILPTSLKTEIVVTANMREWRHIFKLRAAGETGKPHPQIAEVMIPLLKECQEHLPELFGDIQIKEDV